MDILTSFPFKQSVLRHGDVLMLSYYAFQNTSGEDPVDIRLNLNKYAQEDIVVSKDSVEVLARAGLFRRERYSYDLHDYIYAISPEVMVTILIWLYKTDEGHSVLDVLKRVFNYVPLDQTLVQKALCIYIQSTYQDTMLAHQLQTSELIYILPHVTNTNFFNFFSSFNEDTFESFLRTITYQASCDGSIPVAADALIKMVEKAQFVSEEKRNVFLQKAYLYAYLSQGVVPPVSLALNTIDGLMLKAIMETCREDWDLALETFRMAQYLFNKQVGRASTSVMLPNIMANIVYVICCWRANTDASRVLLDDFLKKYERSKNLEVRAAWVLIAALRNAPNYVAEIRYLTMSGNPLSSQFITVLLSYIGRKDVISSEFFVENMPKWLIMRFDNERKIPLTASERITAQNAYYGNHLLTDIYRKKQWEFVLEALSGKVTGNASPEQKPSERLGYFLRNIYGDSCEVRLQTVLKSGLWGSGKVVSYQNYQNLSESHFTSSDINIRNAERVRHNPYRNEVSLLNVLPEMVKESRLYVGMRGTYTLVSVMQEMPYLVVERSDAGFEVKSNVSVDDVDRDVIITSRGASSINFVKMTHELRPYFSQLLALGTFPVEAEQALTTFLESLRGKVEVHSVLVQGGTTLEKVQGTSKISIQMRPQGKEAYVVSVFCRALENGSVQSHPGKGTSVVFDSRDGQRVCVERDLDGEIDKYEKLIAATGNILNSEETIQIDAFDLLPIIDFVRMNPDDYILEWPEGHPLRIHNRYTASQWSGTLKKNKNGWFEMEGEVQLNDTTKMSISALLEMIGTRRSRFIQLSEGEYIALSDRLHKQLLSLDAFSSRSRGKLQMSPFTAAVLDTSLIDGELQLKVDPEILEIRRRILDSSTYTPDVPSTLNATLRSYQVEGYNWMSRLNYWGAGALLADDMGLGKTIQTITFLLSKAEEGPALVVAPASVAPNWKLEFEKFAPSLNVEVLNFAANRSTCIADAKAGDVIITTYGLLLSVKDFITKKEWTTAVLDEAHVIKNRGAKTSGVAMQLNTKYRIMLTGTPVQNHLGELWNLFQFVNPGLLGSYESFSRRFITPIEVGKDKDRQADLERLVHPFMLRRTKDKVLNELPEKTEIYSSVTLSDEEMAVYEVIRERAQEMLENEENDKVSLNTLAELTRLRQASCSAELIEKKWKGKTSKTEALIEALEPIVESGDAALVFSQFTSFLAIVKRELKKAGIPYIYIDGAVSVKERQKLVEQFQRGECPVFIISLKAGGLGLNLTRANYVFHLDPWWNPAIEQQATDRAHRIGQHNAVTVYHFLAASTIEEKIRRMHETKRDLADNILEGTDMSGKITGKELLEMVR